MTGTLAWTLALTTLAIVVVRRRSIALILLALQSLLLGADALTGAAGHSTALLVAGLVLLAKGILLPLGLAGVITRTREPQQITGERHPLARLTIALIIALAVAALIPRFGLLHPGIERVAVALVALGITIALVRRPALFQVLGFLVAENGLYLAALCAPGGLPAFIELGLVFDLMLIVTVAGVFSAKIHEELGTSDTSLLGALHD
jgi:hydrogenase-4 component E